jgi:hypothetical protein
MRKIVLCSLGRCGSTLLFDRIDAERKTFIVDLSNLRGISHSCVIKTHDYFPKFWDTDFKFLFMVGDIYDIVASSYAKILSGVEGSQHFMNFKSDHTRDNQLKILDRDVLNLEKHFDSWYDAYHNKNCEMMILKYEKLWDNIELVNNFLHTDVQLPERRDRKTGVFQLNEDQKDRIHKTYGSLNNKIVNNLKDIQIN